MLYYEVMGKAEGNSFLSVTPQTGRHHQIRCQLAAVGCTIKGDVKYGYPRANPEGSIYLHARRVAFIHPVQHVSLEIIAPPPEDQLWDLFLSMTEISPAASAANRSLKERKKS